METSIFRRLPVRISPWQIALNYGLVIISSITALGVTRLFEPFLQQTPLILLYFAVIVSGRLGGVGPGIAAALTTAFLAEHYVLPAPWVFKQWSDASPVLAYLLASAVTLAFVCTLRARTAILREKEAHLTDFMENATLGLIWLAEDGTIVWANEAACELVGQSARDCVGRNVKEFHVEKGEAADILKRLAGNERIRNYEAQLRTRDGAVKDVLLDANVFWQQGRFIHARCFVRDITPRKRAEEALARERNLLRTLIDALPDYIYTKDRQSRFLVSNLANVRLLGATCEEDVRHKTPLDLCPPDIARRFLEDDEKVFATGNPLFDREEPFRRTTGEERVFLTTKLPLRDAKGEVTGLVGITRDITDRKRADEALRKSEAGLRLAQRIGRIGSWEADLVGDRLEWSEETCRIFGCRSEDFVPTRQAFFGFVHPEDREMVRRAEENALRHGKYFSVDYRIVAADGGERFVVQQARILRDGSGRAVQMLGTVQEITDRKLAEEALRESEGRFRALFERSPEAILILDPRDGDRLLPIVDCNEVACRQHGYERSELVGQAFGLIEAGVKTREQVKALIDQVREDHLVRFETSRQHKDGGTVCFESWVSLIVVGNRELLLVMGRDISERKRGEEAIRRLNEELEARVQERTRQLEQANRELEAFSYSISHDLRAPLRAISGFTQIIHEDHGHELNGEASRLMKIISGSAQRMGELIDDLLGFSRLTTYEPKHGAVNMTALVQSVAAELSHLPPNQRVSVRLAELPEASGDESMLRQVFANLIANAMKFSRDSAQPTVSIGAEDQDWRIVYFVRDNGVGFDMKYAPKLFKVFQRLHNPEQFEGTGVGLAIVHRVVQRHGGEAWAESEPGKGATFFFSLPAKAPLPARQMQPVQSP